ncbi:MAG: hypothetical protein RML36_09440 [Anaerolineae bacterium]|nr:hypothetical protein [Anaerolineae bacterium]MDW8099687.1 hypothetical protein [Anaerolineae bacterium]
MPALNSIARTMYLLCLTITLFVAIISLLSGVGFDAMIARMAVALVGSGVLSWAAILALLPTPARSSEGPAAAEASSSAAVSPSGLESASAERGQTDDNHSNDADREGYAVPASS